MASATFVAPTTRLSGVAFVLLLHAALVFGLMVSLGHVTVSVPRPPVSAEVLVEAPPPPKTIDPVVLAPTPVPSEPLVPAIQSAGSGGIHVAVQVGPRAIAGRPNARPSYPEASIRLGEEGSVVLLLLVGEDGRVKDARIDVSSGHRRLDRAASAEALRSYRFLPGTEDGRPKAMWHRVKVTFRLADARG